jgi:hypothetical protein
VLQEWTVKSPLAMCPNIIINGHIDGLHHCFCSGVIDSVGTTTGGVPQKYAFITFGIKLSQIFPVS